jgi:LDH2 family malate/lactate/ureidoglycolate dehydrogenase
MDANHPALDVPAIAPGALRRFTCEVALASGADDVQAGSLADVLVWCDQVGRNTQGVWRLPLLASRISRGLIKCPCHPEFSRRAAAMELLDGDAGLGHHIGRLAMNRALEIAKDAGMGAVTVRNSNFFGAAAYYVQLAAERGMLGIAMSNSFPKVAAYGGMRPVLGTNPIAFAAPRPDGRSILVDMATSAMAGSSVTKIVEQQSGRLLDNVAIDGQGNPLTVAEGVQQGSLLPFGGPKGFGLALMVEILSGVITGAGFSHGVKSMYKNFAETGDNGHFMLAIDISRLMPTAEYHARVEQLIAWVKASADPATGNKVLIPGEVRWDAYEESLKSGIVLDRQTILSLDQLADQYRVVVPW